MPVATLFYATSTLSSLIMRISPLLPPARMDRDRPLRALMDLLAALGGVESDLEYRFRIHITNLVPFFFIMSY